MPEYWIDRMGQVYAGDRQRQDKSAPARPSDAHRWDAILQDWALPVSSVKDRLTALFVSEVNSYADNALTNAQLNQLSQLSASVQRAHEFAPVISPGKYKGMLLGAVNSASLPATFDGSKQKLIDFINANL